MGPRGIVGLADRRRLALLAIAITAIGMALAMPSLAFAVPANDNYGAAQSLPLYSQTDGDTTTATVQNPEPMTPNTGSSCNGSKMAGTIWYKVTGTGGPMTINTFYSVPDTVIAAYNTNGLGTDTATSGRPSQANFLACNDQAADTNQSRMTFNAIAGRVYLIQVGGYIFNGSASRGPVRIVATDGVAENDDRIDALDLTAGEPFDWYNWGATEEPGENLVCTDADGNESALASTVWFHYAASKNGTAVFTSSTLDTVMQVYRGDSDTPLQCNDDGPNQVGSSRISLEVTPGDYYIQVGGYAGEQGPLTMSTEFTEDLDGDNDGYSRPADCNDNDPKIHPGAVDIPDNGIDEDCSGTGAVNTDRDGDSFHTPQDCNDSNGGIHPGATDVPENGVDEDCNGSDAPNLDRDRDGIPRPADCNDGNAAIHPGAHDTPGDDIDQDCSGKDGHFPALVLKYRYFISPNGLVKTLTAKVRKGSKVKVSCKGHGCPKPKTYRSKGRKLNLRGPFHHALGGGSRISIRVTRRGYIGKVAQITYRSNKKPSERVLCIPVGKKRPQKSCS
jgi:hypothetical protein